MHVRPLLAAALAALLAVPAVATAQAKKRPASRPAAQPARTQAAPARMQTLSVGGFLGYEMGDLDGLMLRFDAELPIQKVSPQLMLSGVGSIGYTRFSADVLGGDITWNVFKLVPAARLTMPVSPELSLYGDAGLGLYYGRSTLETTLPIIGTTKVSDSTVGLLMRIGVGAFFKVNPKTRLAGSIELDPYFGDADTTNFTIMAGVMFDI